MTDSPNQNSAEGPQGTLQGKVALVTGGSSGIGRAIAEALVGAGASVAISGRRPAPVEKTAAELRASGGQAVGIAGDVSDPAGAQKMVTTTVEALGGLDILVNNAGIARGGPLGSMPREEIDAVVDIDLKGPIYVTQAALPHLSKNGESGGASVINISSSVTFMATRNFSVYSAAKAGLEMLTRCWALDYSADQIRFNAISPGVVETPIFETMMPAAAVAGALEQFSSATPLGRVGQPADIGHLALFLASPASAWLTGAVIPLDGGLSLGS
ncbi:MAG: SDR family oxidoreductase [Deltaproteobacteria bacterium]|nr:SDR family oxidoreductase [Deltaproteobacteria bacterium]